MSQVSSEAIDSYVNSLLKDPKKNIPWVPDSIEYKVHSMISKALLESLAKICDHVSVEVMGHEISLQVHPKRVVQVEKSLAVDTVKFISQ